MQEARAPYTDNMEQLRDVMDTVSDIVMVPGTQFRYPHTVGTIFWGTHTDVDEEGTWVNYYTKERVDQELVDNAIGGVSSSRMSNCAVVGSIFNGWLDWKCLLLRNIFRKLCKALKLMQELYQCGCIVYTITTSDLVNN